VKYLLYVDHVVGRGEDLFKIVCDADLEGVVAKWKRGAYMPDDRTSWVKIRNPNYTQVIGRDKMFEKRVGNEVSFRTILVQSSQRLFLNRTPRPRSGTEPQMRQTALNRPAQSFSRLYTVK